MPRSAICAETSSFSVLLMYCKRFAVAMTAAPAARSRCVKSIRVATSENWIAKGSIAPS